MEQQVDDTNCLSGHGGRNGDGTTSSSGVVVGEACAGRSRGSSIGGRSSSSGSSIGSNSSIGIGIGNGSRAVTRTSHGQ